jgi:hypothetical protein
MGYDDNDTNNAQYKLVAWYIFLKFRNVEINFIVPLIMISIFSNHLLKYFVIFLIIHMV